MGATLSASVLAVDVPAQVVFGGVLTGLTYGVMAIGIILIYRSSRVVNIAVAATGGLAAAVLARLVLNLGWPYLPSFVLAVGVGALASGVVERTVIRRLFRAPRLIVLVATIGVAQVLLFLQAILPSLSSIRPFPSALDAKWDVAGVVVRGEHVGVLVVIPLASLVLAWFTGRTRTGTAVRAAADNPDAARLAGIPVRRLSTVVWVLAGALSSIAVILAAPLTTASAGEVFQAGPALLVRALVAALVGRMRSMTAALATGVALGVAEAVLYYNRPSDRGLLDLVLLGVVLVCLLALARSTPATPIGSGASPWPLSARERPLPAVVLATRWGRYVPAVSRFLVLCLALLPLVAFDRASQQFLFARVLLYALVALSLTVLTGWAGQVSLGQFAFVGVGAMSTAALTAHRVGFGPSLAIAALVGAGLAVVIGLPALRLPGLFLAVSTLAFAVAATSWLLGQPVFTSGRRASAAAGANVQIKRAHLGSFTFDSQRTFYALCLLCLAGVILALVRLRRSGIGRSFLAVRDNEAAAAALGISPERRKLLAFALAGAIAGFAGSLLGGLLVTFDPSRFAAGESLAILTVGVIGGLSSVSGTVLGAAWVVGLPALFGDNQSVALLTSGVGLLLLLLYFPYGLLDALQRGRDRVLVRLAGGEPTTGEAGRPDPPSGIERPDVEVARLAALARRPSAGADTPALRVEGVRVRFGVHQVVDDVSLTVGRGEIVGLIGANGAGKSTLMHAVGGFVEATGRVWVGEREVTGRPPHLRARAGLGRSFQGAELFSDLTVREALQLATEGRTPTRVWPTVLGLPAARRREAASLAAADELVERLGLQDVANRCLDELSTGSRRIVELGCLLAFGAEVLCLDEPTAGLAQAETEAFGPLLRALRDEAGLSILVIEHDMPLVMAVSDRILCLEAGRLIAEGDPDTIRHDPRVVASYLGTDLRAIERSGSVGARPPADGSAPVGAESLRDA